MLADLFGAALAIGAFAVAGGTLVFALWLAERLDLDASHASGRHTWPTFRDAATVAGLPPAAARPAFMNLPVQVSTVDPRPGRVGELACLRPAPVMQAWPETPVQYYARRARLSVADTAPIAAFREVTS